ncbi:hypothetical protein EFM11_05330 [Lactobacillus helveticus]|nr:SLAP domain-containing protein [Lactobacillus helveticus]MCT0164897.1 hypothetical protein [Lactobacillus helveticus]MCT0192945.1 hypothetical protein [Lactobacillus helveticus]
MDKVLTHNAFLYNLVIKKDGKTIIWPRRMHIKVWNNGKSVMINNKKFYQVDKEAYVKVSNTETYKLRTFKLKHNAYVYDQNGNVVKTGKHHKNIVLQERFSCEVLEQR